MSDAKRVFHGSDLEEIEKVFGIKKEDIVSFSANVNPLGVSKRFRDHVTEHMESFESYPDREYTSLRTSISEYIKVSVDDIMVGSGATELISNVIEAVMPENVLIIEPTYSEYARKLTGENADIHSYILRQENEFKPDMDDFIREVKKGYDLIMICNPNNPTGNALTRNEIEDICRATEGIVLVDETYVEFTDVDIYSCVLSTERFDNLVVLRGTSKFFSTPGLRLGYSVCGNEALRKKIYSGSDPWSVNSVAAVSGGILFQDKEYIAETKGFITEEMKWMTEELKSLQLHVYEPVANIVLSRIKNHEITSDMVFKHCISRGLMIRDCATFKGLGQNHFRICLNKHEQNKRLINVLSEIV